MDLDAALIDELRRVHGVHLVIVYGSRARGTHTAESDIDVAGFADVTETTRDARLWNGLYLDGFVYPTQIATTEPDPDLLKLCGGRVLLDERKLAPALFERLVSLERQGPPVLVETEQRMRRVWARKMLARIRRGDLEAHYRYHWLLYQLLEDHFALRGEWYRGPKESFAALAVTAPAMLAAFERALVPGASFDAIEALVDHVTSSGAPTSAVPE